MKIPSKPPAIYVAIKIKLKVFQERISARVSKVIFSLRIKKQFLSLAAKLEATLVRFVMWVREI